MTKNQIVKNTLRWCNSQRKKQGLRPLKALPKGKLSDPVSCPCGKASKLEVFCSAAYPPDYSIDDPKGRIKLPVSVQLFVRDFDNGLFPELVEK